MNYTGNPPHKDIYSAPTVQAKGGGGHKRKGPRDDLLVSGARVKDGGDLLSLLYFPYFVNPPPPVVFGNRFGLRITFLADLPLL